jgi:glycolate oxidase FAD binding subunit
LPSASEPGPAVVEPASIEEAATLLAEARAAGRRVGVGEPGSRPRCDVILSTARLDRVVEHEAGDLTCLVQAGVRHSALDAVLARAGQMLALDPPGDPTLGACLAADLSGPRRHRYGTMRDLVLGVTVVLADGTIASAGGKVVKNVAGYDLGKLFCGSRGTLGLVAQIALRLHPRPEAAATLVAPVETPAAAEERAQSILHSDLVPSAVDLLWSAGGGRLALQFEGTGAAVSAQVEETRELLQGIEADAGVWDEVRARQAATAGVRLFAPWRLRTLLPTLDEAVVRVAAGVAHVPEAQPDSRSAGERALAERVRAEFDPDRVLAG